ncbi:hypothetical protein ATANTOWER_019725 [Ataeniobius toweri]|uniref:Uncharacterized protein n=2 Tax=Goodeidae TaxID=28758 RepID=A0ABU7AZX1_9TELE|nr:hypothetical protein [Ataeniobius toweri]
MRHVPVTSGSTVALQQDGPGFEPQPGVFLHGVCMFSLCMHGSSPGGINRAGAAVPTFLRTPTMIQPHLDMKPFLQFPMESPPPHSMSLFHNFNTVSGQEREP